MHLYTGLTGTVGAAICDVLGHARRSVRTLVRDPGRLAATDMEVVQGDMTDADALSRAFRGVSRACLVMANGEHQREAETMFIDAAKAADVDHVVKLSAVGADSGSGAILKRVHGETEEHLRRSGLNYSIVRPNFFMTNLLTAAPTIKQDGAIYWPMGDASVGAVDVHDVARFLVDRMSPSVSASGSYDISGPALLSFSDMADQLSKVLGRDVRYVPISNEAFRKSMHDAGVSPWYVDAVGDLFIRIAKGDSAETTSTYRDIMGVDPVPLSDYLQRAKTAFIE